MLPPAKSWMVAPPLVSLAACCSSCEIGGALFVPPARPQGKTGGHPQTPGLRRLSSHECHVCTSLKEVPRRLERLDEHINCLGGGVDVKAGACGSPNAERTHQRLGAVMYRSDRPAVVIEYCADVVRMEIAGVTRHAAP